MEESIVKVEHLSHRYSVQWAIRDINFEINQKGILGLLGSNGAGKSTTMNNEKWYLWVTRLQWSREIHDHEYHVRGVKTDRGGCLYKGNQY